MELLTSNRFRTFGHSQPAVALGALDAWAIRVPLDEANYVNSARLRRSYGPKTVQMWTMCTMFCGRVPLPLKMRGELLGKRACSSVWCAGSFALLVECQSRSPSASGSSHSTSLRLRNLHTTLRFESLVRPSKYGRPEEQQRNNQRNTVQLIQRPVLGTTSIATPLSIAAEAAAIRNEPPP